MPESRLPNSQAFWAEQDAFRASREEADASGSPSQYVKKRTRWEKAGATYMANAKGSLKGKGLVMPTAASLAMLEKDISTLLGDSEQAMIDAADSIIAAHGREVISRWPVDKGLSRGSIGLQLVIKETRVAVGIVLGAPYVPYIKGAKSESGTSKKRLRFLKKQKDGTWRFDRAAYELAEQGREPDTKPAKGRPYQDMIGRPAAKKAQACLEAARDNMTEAINGR